MSDDLQHRVRVAAVQAAPVFLQNEKTVARGLELVRGAAEDGCKLVVFPEAFVPGYPRGFSFGAVVGHRSDAGRDLFARYQQAAIFVDGAEIQAFAEAAREHELYLLLGFVEKERRNPRGTLYCSFVLLGPGGEVLLHHRKIRPTASERLIWGEGDGSSLTTAATPFGRIGGLICWENYMPLARMALYESGIDIYLAPTADARDSWQATLRHIACESRCFVIGCNQFVRKSDYPEDLRRHPEMQHRGDILCRGGTAILDPFGNYLAGPLFDEPGVLVADLDLGQIRRARFDFDPAGHYGRPGLFHFEVNSSRYQAGD